MALSQIDPSAPEWWPVAWPSSAPGRAVAIGVLVALVVVAMVVLGACSSDDGQAVVTAAAAGSVPPSLPPSSPPSTASDVTPSPSSTPSSTATETSIDEGSIGERRLAFLVRLVSDPASIGDTELAAQFAPSFLAQIPPDAIRAAAADAAAGAVGPWTVASSELDDEGGVATITASDGTSLTVTLALEPTGDRLITMAQLLPAAMADVEQVFLEPGTLAGPDGIDAALDAVAPRVTYAVFDATDGACTTLLERNGDAVVPMGSSFKLWVLAALARAVRDGDASWDETMPVTQALRSSPDGEVYALADGTPVTLERLAELMISISDNTATDHLIARIGRERIEATMAELGLSTVERNTPFLTTAEFFSLKFVHPELGDRYLALADASERRAFLETEVATAGWPWIDDPEWVPGTEFSTPRLVDEIEWFATPLDVCRTFQDLDRLAAEPGLEPVARILEINPGLPFPPGQWETIRFKGGSEPGVVMFAHWMETADGDRRVVVVSLTDPDRAFGELAPVVPVARLLGLTAQQLSG